MADKQHHSEKDMKNHYKARISELEKLLKSEENKNYALRCRIKELESKLTNKKVTKRKEPVKVDKREIARKNAIEAKERAKKEREK